MADTETDTVSCAICLEVYKTPKDLPCLHSFCQACLQTYITNIEEKGNIKDGFQCPVCRTVTTAPIKGVPASEWADYFPTNTVLLSAKGNRNMCDPCRFESISTDAKKFCKECQELLCEGCIKHHKTFKLFRNHVLVQLDEATENESIEIGLDSCRIHKDKQVEFFCVDHDKLCCSTCAIVDHRKCHDLQEISVICTGVKDEQKVKTMFNNISELSKEAVAVVKTIEDNVTNVDQAASNLKKELNEIRTKTMSNMTKLEETVLKQLDTRRKSDLLRLEGDEAKWKGFSAAIKSTHIQAKKVVTNGTDAQAFVMSKILEDQIKQYSKQMSEERVNLRLVSFKLDIAEQFSYLVENDGRLGKLTFQEYCPAVQKAVLLSVTGPEVSCYKIMCMS